MITFEQATACETRETQMYKSPGVAVPYTQVTWTHNEFHYGTCERFTGPRGGVKMDQTRVRRSGKTQTWKTRPGEFRIPVKYGMYESGEITHHNAADFHLPSECVIVDKA